MKILLAGASGLIGTELKRQLALAKHEVRILVRRPPTGPDEYLWAPESRSCPQEAIDWADAVVSLSGASLSRLPWTRQYRAEIVNSRVRATSAIAEAICASAAPPSGWVSGSAVGYYGDRPGEELDEDSARGEGYLSDVVAAWEKSTGAAKDATRVVHARTGLVLATDGALRPLALATRLGLGSAVGNGQQHWPWISLDDEAGALIHLATASALEGVVNLVGPAPATSREITSSLAAALHRPHLFSLPRPLLKAAMGLAADELLLADQRVMPIALLGDGFAFRHKNHAEAIATAVKAPQADQ